MSENESFNFDELKEQYKCLNEKLEGQSIINDSIISSTLKEKVNSVEKWYRRKFAVYAMIPILACSFFIQKFDEFFVLFFLATALLEGILTYRNYKALNPKELLHMPMTVVTENIIRHRYLLSLSQKIMLIPAAILLAWTVCVASDYTLNYFAITICILLFAVGFTVGYREQRKQLEKLNDVLRSIKKWKE